MYRFITLKIASFSIPQGPVAFEVFKTGAAHAYHVGTLFLEEGTSSPVKTYHDGTSSGETFTSLDEGAAALLAGAMRKGFFMQDARVDASTLVGKDVLIHGEWRKVERVVDGSVVTDQFVVHASTILTTRCGKYIHLP